MKWIKEKPSAIFINFFLIVLPCKEFIPSISLGIFKNFLKIVIRWFCVHFDIFSFSKSNITLLDYREKAYFLG